MVVYKSSRRHVRETRVMRARVRACVPVTCLEACGFARDIHFRIPGFDRGFLLLFFFFFRSVTTTRDARARSMATEMCAGTLVNFRRTGKRHRLLIIVNGFINN